MRRTLIPHPIESFMSTFEDDGRQILVAEPPRLQRLYDDSCDQGIAIQGHTRVAEFVIVTEEYDKEGDLLWIDLAPIPGHENVRCRVRLYND